MLQCMKCNRPSLVPERLASGGLICPTCYQRYGRWRVTRKVGVDDDFTNDNDDRGEPEKQRKDPARRCDAVLAARKKRGQAGADRGASHIAVVEEEPTASPTL